MEGRLGVECILNLGTEWGEEKYGNQTVDNGLNERLGCCLFKVLDRLNLDLKFLRTRFF